MKKDGRLTRRLIGNLKARLPDLLPHEFGRQGLPGRDPNPTTKK